MGMDVDEAGGDDPAARVDLFAPGGQVRADRDDAVAVDRDIRRERLAARAVDDRAAANHQIIHWLSPAFGFWMKPIKIGRAQSELQSLMRISYAVFCLKKKKTTTHNNNHERTEQ